MKNITENRLKDLWERLDRVDGEMYEIFETLRMLGMEDKEELGKEIVKELERVDVGIITNAKNKVEELLVKRTGKGE